MRQKGRYAEGVVVANATDKVSLPPATTTRGDAPYDPGRCPICSGDLRPTSVRYGPADVLARWEYSHQSFPQEVRDTFAVYPPTTLYRCACCGCGFYLPAWAASEAFYDALQTDSDTYYLEDKWEYQQALRLARPGDRVLDVGCGAGCFLELARSRGAIGVGIETAPCARTLAEARGFDVHDCDIADAEAPVGHEFDMVCAFQVLEHIVDPVAFARAMADRARPGGTLVLGVPNAEGSLRWDKDCSFNIPPHHLTTWTGGALRALADKLGLSVIELANEPLDIVHHWGYLAGWWEDTVLRGRGVDAPNYTPTGFLRRVGSRGIRNSAKAATRAGIRTIPWIRGHTVQVALRKPG